MTEIASTTKSVSPSSSSGSSSESVNEETASLSVLDLSGALFANKIRGRENKRSKAARLLVTGRLRVLRVERHYIAAECRGDSGEIYNLGWHHERWTCSCKAKTDCSHLNALWAVVAVNR